MIAGELDELGAELLAARADLTRSFDDAVARARTWNLPDLEEAPCSR